MDICNTVNVPCCGCACSAAQAHNNGWQTRRHDGSALPTFDFFHLQSRDKTSAAAAHLVFALVAFKLTATDVASPLTTMQNMPTLGLHVLSCSAAFSRNL
jgi:hypothetical protein